MSLGAWKEITDVYGGKITKASYRFSDRMVTVRTPFGSKTASHRRSHSRAIGENTIARIGRQRERLEIACYEGTGHTTFRFSADVLPKDTANAQRCQPPPLCTGPFRPPCAPVVRLNLAVAPFERDPF